MRGFANSGELDVPTLLGSVESGPDRGVLLVRRQAAERLVAEADSVLAAADEQRRNAIALSGGLVGIALLLTYVVSRSITRPLSSLTKQAEAMAGETLPLAVKSVLDTPLGEDVVIPDVDPISVKTRDEVRDVAAALNVVQQSALDLAVEQAVLRRNIADSFVNMGRRNQNLLDRQLDFITDLEREEQDGDRLASLFRLDHLATRMRRNAESLLRLAGSEPQRSMTAPIEMGDVVRGALGEVEDYQRVHVRSMDPASVPGGVGADLAHALAELLENALSFSPPTEPVEVRGRRTADGYVLAIADIGLGMTPEELAVANRRLAGEESFTVAPSRYLGHYVAGYLASRVGVRIELHPGPAGGLIARFDIPSSLLVGTPDAPVRPTYEPEPEPAYEPAEEPVPVGVLAAAEAETIEVADAFAPAPASVPELTEVAPPPASDPFAPLGPLPRRTPGAATAGFGGLAPLAPFVESDGNGNGNGNGHSYGDADDHHGLEAPATTASGLVRRVPGAQHPTTDIGARINGEGNGDRRPADRMSADAVSSFLSDFSAGVARGIDEAGRNPWEDGDEHR
jgi:signal transduction histidine kinase